MTKAAVLAQMGNTNQTFPPTLLLVQTHNVTGKKYFCKLSALHKANWYKGSGIYWLKHLKKHGKDVSTTVLGFYLDKQRCVDAALKFSKENNIVESNEWLNIIEENGLNGAGSGKNNVMYGRSPAWKGKERPEMKGRFAGKLSPRFGKPSPMKGVPKPKGKDSPLYGRKRPDGGGKKPNPVIRIDEAGNEKYYVSVSDAAKDVSVTRAMINRCCLGKQKTSAGYKWRYAND